MKIKVRKIKHLEERPQKSKTVNMDNVNNFVYCCRNLQYAPIKLQEYLDENFKRIFPKRKNPKGETLGAVYLAIAYEIQKRCYDESRSEMPVAVREKYEAAVNFNLQQSEAGIGSIFEYKHSTTNSGEPTMKSKTVVVRKKIVPEVKEKKQTEKRVSASAAFVACFSEMAKGKRMTDAQVAEAVNKQTGKEYNEKDAKGYRAGYNRGALSGQTSKPEVSVEAYEPKAAKK